MLDTRPAPKACPASTPWPSKGSRRAASRCNAPSTPGVPAFAVVGLPDKAVSEARERVRTALSAMAIALPSKRITVNLSPADLPKEGSHFDLPIALALLAALDIVPRDKVETAMALGELSLDGTLVAVIGRAAHGTGGGRGRARPLLPLRLRGRGRLGRGHPRLRRPDAGRADRASDRPPPARPRKARRGARGGASEMPVRGARPGTRETRDRDRGGRAPPPADGRQPRLGASRCWPPVSPASCPRSPHPRRWKPR